MTIWSSPTRAKGMARGKNLDHSRLITGLSIQKVANVIDLSVEVN